MSRKFLLETFGPLNVSFVIETQKFQNLKKKQVSHQSQPLSLVYLFIPIVLRATTKLTDIFV